MASDDSRRLARELRGEADELTVRLRVLEESRATIRLSAALSPIQPEAVGQDIEALAFIVLMEASKSAQDDLKAIMEKIRAINAAKERQRRFIAEMKAAAAERASLLEREYDDLVDLVGAGATESSGLVLIEGQLLDSTESADLDSVLETLLFGYGIVIEKEGDRLMNKLDSLSEMGEMESLRLQMAMDRLSKMMSTISNMLKKLADTNRQIAQNLK